MSKQVALMLRLQEESIQGYANLQTSVFTQSLNASTGNSSTTIENNNSMKKVTASTAQNLMNENNSSAKKKNLKSTENMLTTSPSSTIFLSDNIGRNSMSSIIPNNINNSKSYDIISASLAVATTHTTGQNNPSGVWSQSPSKDISTTAVTSDSQNQVIASSVSTVDRESSSTSPVNSNSIASITPNLTSNINASASANSSGGSGGGGGVSSSSSTTIVERIRMQRKPVFDKKLDVMESMQQQSSLANELRLIYHGLVGKYVRSHSCAII